MKAGIYQCYDGTLLYIAKDRTIKAFTSCVYQDEWTGEVLCGPEGLITVATAEREQLARFMHNNRTVEAKRVDNVPNGCTDPLRALARAALSVSGATPHFRRAEENEHLVDYIYAGCPSGGAKTLLKADCDHCSPAVCDECVPEAKASDQSFRDWGQEVSQKIEAAGFEKTSGAGAVFTFTGDPARMSSRELKLSPFTVDSEMDRIFGPPSTYPIWERTPPQEAFDRDLILNGEAAAIVEKKDGAFSVNKNLIFASGDADALPPEAQDRRFMAMPFNTAPVLIAHAEDPAAEGNALHARFAQEYLGGPLAAKQAEGRMRRSTTMPAVMAVPYGKESVERVGEKVRRLGEAARSGVSAFAGLATAFSDVAQSRAAYKNAMADLRESGRAMLRKKGFRICHKGSAKKHRKQGHYVIPLFDGTFAWRERTPAEREAVDAPRHAARTLRNMKVMTIGWPVGCGKTGVTQRG